VSALHPISLPCAVNYSLQACVSGSRMTQSGRIKTYRPAQSMGNGVTVVTVVRSESVAMGAIEGDGCRKGRGASAGMRRE
jgi:hypothetical protein